MLCSSLTFLTMFKFNWIKDFIKYLGSFPNAFSENSTKLLALLICALAGGFLMVFVIPFTLIWDVVTNGYIKTDLTDYAVFLLSVGAVMIGAGLNIKVPEWARGRIGKKKPPHMPMAELEETEEEMYGETEEEEKE